MTYRITVSSNPKSLFIILLVLALPTVGFLSFFLLPIFLSIILTIVAGFFSYHLGKYVVNIFRSRLDTNDVGLVYKMSRK